MKTHYKIHPAIGIARLGNSPTSFYIAPESTGALPIECDNEGNTTSKDGAEAVIRHFKDDQGRIRRQAARFRVYGYDDSSPQGRELRIGDTITVVVQKSGQTLTGRLLDIQWTVYLANKKAAWFQFQETAGEHGYGPDHPLRNPDITNAQDRQQLVIDPGARTVQWTQETQRTATFASGQAGTTFPPPLSPNSIDTLGELRSTQTVDGHNRLLVLGGFGNSGSYRQGFGEPKIEHYANNDGWFDDTSDGPVSAALSIAVDTISGQPAPSGTVKSIPVDESAWVMAGYPRYAPQIVDIVTMDELVYDLAVRHFGAEPLIYGRPPFDGTQKPSAEELASGVWEPKATWNPNYYPYFWRDIWPILSRPFNYQYVMDFDPTTGGDPHETARGSGGNFDPDIIAIPPHAGEDPAKQRFRCNARAFLFDVLRKPGQENRLAIDPKVLGKSSPHCGNGAEPPSPHAPKLQTSNGNITGPFAMPLLCGDNPITNHVPSKFLRLTDTMLFLLRQWALGKFINEKEEGITPPEPPEAVALDRGVLGNALGGSFCPGGEACWIMRDPAIYRAPYRIRAAAGYSTGGLTIPTAGTGLAGSPGLAGGLEPGDITKYSAQPWQSDFNECYTQDIDVTYENWNVLYPSSTGDPMQSWSWTTYWWPSHRPVTVNNNAWSPTQQNNAGDLAMVTLWPTLSFIRDNPDATVQKLQPAFIAVEPPQS